MVIVAVIIGLLLLLLSVLESVPIAMKVLKRLKLGDHLREWGEMSWRRPYLNRVPVNE